MYLAETNTHSFVIRIWLEETPQETPRPTWRGHITHVPSGQRRYLQDLNEMVAFIRPYVEEMKGADASPPRRMRVRLFRRFRRPR